MRKKIRKAIIRQNRCIPSKGQLEKLVQRCAASTVPVHNSQKLEDVLDPNNYASGVWADSAYCKETEAMLDDRMMKSYIPRRGSRREPLTRRHDAANKTRSKVHARVEHVFGTWHTSMDGKFISTIGIVRATVKIGMQNLAYNMRRLVALEKAAAAVN